MRGRVLQYQTRPKFRAYSHEGMELRSLRQCTLQLREDPHTQHEEDLARISQSYEPYREGKNVLSAQFRCSGVRAVPAQQHVRTRWSAVLRTTSQTMQANAFDRWRASSSLRSEIVMRQNKRKNPTMVRQAAYVVFLSSTVSWRTWDAGYATMVQTMRHGHFSCYSKETYALRAFSCVMHCIFADADWRHGTMVNCRPNPLEGLGKKKWQVNVVN